MNTYFLKWKNRKWTLKCPNNQTKSESDFTLAANKEYAGDAQIVGEVRIRDDIIVRRKITLDVRRERNKLVTRKK